MRKYMQAVKNILIDESSFPSVAFVRFLANKLFASQPTEQAIDEFAPVVKEAFQQFIEDRIRQSATARSSGYRRKLQGEGYHVTSDEEFEGFFVVNVA